MSVLTYSLSTSRSSVELGTPFDLLPSFPIRTTSSLAPPCVTGSLVPRYCGRDLIDEHLGKIYSLFSRVNTCRRRENP